MEPDSRPAQPVVLVATALATDGAAESRLSGIWEPGGCPAEGSSPESRSLPLPSLRRMRKRRFRAQIVDLAFDELIDARKSDQPLIGSLRADARTLFGADLHEFLADEVTDGTE